MVARVVGGQGLGAWPPGGALLVSDSGETAGALLGGTVSEPVVGAATSAMAEGRSAVRLSVRVGEEEAVAAGLACAGEAHIALESMWSLPEVLWSDLAANRPVALVVRTEEDPTGGGGTLVVRADGTMAGSLGEWSPTARPRTLRPRCCADPSPTCVDLGAGRNRGGGGVRRLPSRRGRRWW